MSSYDVVVVGAGIGGIYAVQRFHADGLSVLCLEGAAGLGGVWYHNRYPGARVDLDSIDYCYHFSPELYEEWRWSERFATQPELLDYLNHVADKFDLTRRIRFGTWVTGAVWQPDRSEYDISTSTGDRYRARFLVMATGNLSAARTPEVPGLEDFKGEWVQTSHWPEREVDVSGKRVAIVGTGSSGVQAVPVVAEKAAHLFVFQRTPNYSVPANNGPLDEVLWNAICADVPTTRNEHWHGAAIHMKRGEHPVAHYSAAARVEIMERQWRLGGQAFGAMFTDQTIDEVSNASVADFVRDKIRHIVRDPEIAERLCPWDHPIGTRRLCLDSGYYEAFNRENVTLVDARDRPIESITATGIQTPLGHYQVDLVIFALGFRAFTGAIENARIRNHLGVGPTDSWKRGPRTFLGLMTTGFPNFFMLTGAGSPSVLSNMFMANEFHVDWVADLIEYMHEHGHGAVEPTAEAVDAWCTKVARVAEPLLRRNVDNYMVHVNCDDGSRVFIPYAGGLGRYVEEAEKIAADEYNGLAFR